MQGLNLDAPSFCRCYSGMIRFNEKYDQPWQIDILNRMHAGRSQAIPAPAPSSQQPHVSFRPPEPPLDSGGERELSELVSGEDDLGEGWDFGKERR